MRKDFGETLIAHVPPLGVASLIRGRGEEINKMEVIKIQNDELTTRKLSSVGNNQQKF